MTDVMKCDRCDTVLPCSDIKLSGGLITLRFPDIGEKEIGERLCPICMGKTITVEGL